MSLLRLESYETFFFYENWVIKGTVAPPAVFLTPQVFVLFLQCFHLFSHLLYLTLLPFTIVLGINLGSLLLMADMS